MPTPWYYAISGDRKGPVEEEQLRQLMQQGVVTSETLVWTAGMSQWLPARAVAALSAGVAAPPAIPSVPAATPDTGLVATVIPYHNSAALAAYYCGVFSILPCFPIGLAGLVLGIIGLKRAKANPEIKGQAHAWIGIIAGGLFGFGWLVLTALFIAGVLSFKHWGR